MLSYLIIGITFAFAAAVQPGPMQSYLISQALRKGWKHTLPAAFAPIITDGPIIVLVVFLLSHVPEKMIIILQFVGGIFLFYLAWDAWKAWKNFDTKKFIHQTGSRTTLKQAVIVNFLNPAPYIGWSLVMGPILIKAWRESYVFAIVLVSGFYATIVICQTGIVFLFAHAGKLGPRTDRILIGLSAIALACFGIYEFWLGLKSF